VSAGNVNKRARCPECRRTVNTYTDAGRLLFVHHHDTTRGRESILSDERVCVASRWLVEDDELVVKPECGTCAGYQRHLRDGEPTCVECRAANASRLRAERAAYRAEVGR